MNKCGRKGQDLEGDSPGKGRGATGKSLPIWGSPSGLCRQLQLYVHHQPCRMRISNQHMNQFRSRVFSLWDKKEVHGLKNLRPERLVEMPGDQGEETHIRQYTIHCREPGNNSRIDYQVSRNRVAKGMVTTRSNTRPYRTQTLLRVHRSPLVRWTPAFLAIRRETSPP